MPTPTPERRWPRHPHSTLRRARARTGSLTSIPGSRRTLHRLPNALRFDTPLPAFQATAHGFRVRRMCLTYECLHRKCLRALHSFSLFPSPVLGLRLWRLISRHVVGRVVRRVVGWSGLLVAVLYRGPIESV